MLTLRWYSMRFVVMTLALLGATALPAHGDVASDGPKVGQWKTWVLASSTEIQVPTPPAETSDQTKAELAELRQLQKERSPSANTAIQYYNAVPATQRWHDLAFTLARAAPPQSPNRQAYLAAILHTALHDAVIVTWAAKYQFNRKPPSQMAPDVTLVVPITGAVPALEPSYPSEHAALAGTAVGILTSFFPKEEANLKAMATELGQTRLLMGANYRSDIDSGFALGQAVAQKALARAATDGSDTKWTGTVPTGPGLWGGKNPLEPLMGTWKPWMMTRGDQFRPGPPPAFGSAEFQEELALLKRINSNPTPSQRAIATNYAANFFDLVWGQGYALVRRERLSVPREVRLLAPFAALQVDAYIAAHDAKYTAPIPTSWRLRPNMADYTIVPLIPVPNHPAYVSNAAIIASAAAELVGYMFPQEAAYWQYLGEEAGLSRIYGGIHYPSDERAGNQMGKSIAALAIQRDQLNGP
jgi:membrane-associated phospholipid phosphatase